MSFPFLDGDDYRLASYGVYISQLIRFARVCNHVAGFNAQSKCLTAKLRQQGYRYHKLRKTFSKFYRRHYVLISKFNVGLKTLFARAFRNHNFMVAWFTNLRKKLKEGVMFLFSSENHYTLQSYRIKLKCYHATVYISF